MRSVEPIDVPPYLWTIKAIRKGKWAWKSKETDKNQLFTLHGATQKYKYPRAPGAIVIPLPRAGIAAVFAIDRPANAAE
jgi:hypothetical protein